MMNESRGRQRFLILVLTIQTIISYSCASLKTIPEMQPKTLTGFNLYGEILYDGKEEYFPKTIKESSENSNLQFNYEYEVKYLTEDNSIVGLFNPLTIVGCPYGSDSLRIEGKLIVKEKENIIKTYTAYCTVNKRKNLFSSGDLSKLRSDGLIAIRDNIYLQLYEDKNFFENYMTNNLLEEGDSNNENN